MVSSGRIRRLRLCFWIKRVDRLGETQYLPPLSNQPLSQASRLGEHSERMIGGTNPPITMAPIPSLNMDDWCSRFSSFNPAANMVIPPKIPGCAEPNTSRPTAVLFMLWVMAALSGCTNNHVTAAVPTMMTRIQTSIGPKK